MVLPSVRSLKHCLELLPAEVGGTPVDIYLYGFAVDRNVAVFVHVHARGFLQQVFAVAAHRKGRVADVEHYLVELTLNELLLGFHFHLAELLALFAKRQQQIYIARLHLAADGPVAYIRDLEKVFARGRGECKGTCIVRDSARDEGAVGAQKADGGVSNRGGLGVLHLAREIGLGKSNHGT